MLSSTFEPCFWPENLTSELGFSDYAFLMPMAGEMAQRSERSALTEYELAMMDAISTIHVQTQLDSDITNMAAPEKPQFDEESINSATISDISATAPAEETPNETEAADDTGQREVNKARDIDEGEDSDSDTDSEVSTVSYGSDGNEDAEPVSPGLRVSQSARHSFTSITTPTSKSRRSSELSHGNKKEICDNVRVPISLAPSDVAKGSNDTDLLDEVYNLISPDASRAPRPDSRSQSRSLAQSDPLHQTLTPPKTPVPAHEASPSVAPISFPPFANTAPIQFDPTTTNISIKHETSTPSTSPSSISVLTSQLSALTAELRNTTALLDSQNTNLDTLSPRLNNLVTDCTHLAKTRKSLLAKRKALNIEINNNRDALEDRKNGTKILREEQIELLHSREQTQHEINVLTQKKRDTQKDLSAKKYETALEKHFADRGCREIARKMGWQPPASTPEDDGNREGEQAIFDDDLSLHYDSDEDEELKEGNEADFHRVAQALITRDTSLDFAALSRFREGLGVVDDEIKKEAAASPEDRAVRIKTERRSGSIDDASNRRADDDESMFFPENAAEVKSVEGGEITMEKIQAKLRSFDHIRDDLAEMFKVLAGGSKALKSSKRSKGRTPLEGRTGIKRKSDQAGLDLDEDLGSEEDGDRGGAAAGDNMSLRKKKRSSHRGGSGGGDGRDGFGRGGRDGSGRGGFGRSGFGEGYMGAWQDGSERCWRALRAETVSSRRP